MTFEDIKSRSTTLAIKIPLDVVIMQNVKDLANVRAFALAGPMNTYFLGPSDFSCE